MNIGLNINDKTETSFDKITTVCKEVWISKLADYGMTWCSYRLMTVVDHILIKALRIKTLEENGGNALVEEGQDTEFVGIINYSIIALILFYHAKEFNAECDTDKLKELCQKYYNEITAEIRRLLTIKNHDYGEAWRVMEKTSFTDIIIARVQRMKSIIKNDFDVNSENVDAQLMDIVNYAVFALIKLTE